VSSGHQHDDRSGIPGGPGGPAIGLQHRVWRDAVLFTRHVRGTDAKGDTHDGGRVTKPIRDRRRRPTEQAGNAASTAIGLALREFFQIDDATE
jgi:hypothetical protein